MKKFFEILFAIICVLSALAGYVLIFFLLYGLHYKMLPFYCIIIPPLLGFSCTYLLGMMYLFYEDDIKEYFNRFKK